MLSNIIKLKGSDSNKDINNNNNPYLEFKSSTPMRIKPRYTNTGITLQYSLDTVTWTNIAAEVATPSANTIYFRGSATGTKRLFTSSYYGNAWTFTNATNLEIHGDITMLLQDTLGGVIRDIALGDYAFAYMFFNCTSLTVAPELPTTTLANFCYNYMFGGCTSLTVAPELPATTLVDNCYSYMFYQCTSLTVAPELPATTLAPSCYGGMFVVCTSLTTVPSLPATTLANFCYVGMFQNCTGLTVVPELPATTLATGCYNSMFSGCSSLKFSLTKNGEYQKEYRIPTVGTGVTSSGWNTSMFNNTGGTFVGTPAINTTYYVPNGLI